MKITEGSIISAVSSENYFPEKECQRVIPGEGGSFGSVRLVLYPDDSCFWIMNRQRMIMERRLPNGEITRCFNYTADYITHIPNEKTLLLARPIWTGHWVIREIDTDDIYEQKGVYYDGQSAITQLLCRNDGKRFLAVFEDGCVKEWERKQKVFREYKIPGEIISSASYHPDGESILFGTKDSLICMFKEGVIKTLSLTKNISMIYAQTCNKKIYAVLDNGTLVEVKLEDKIIRSLGETSNICIRKPIALHPSESKALIPIGKSIVEWNLSEDSFVYCYDVHKDEVTSVAYHQSGQKFLSGSKDGYVYEWNRSEKSFRRYC